MTLLIFLHNSLTFNDFDDHASNSKTFNESYSNAHYKPWVLDFSYFLIYNY